MIQDVVPTTGTQPRWSTTGDGADLGSTVRSGRAPGSAVAPAPSWPSESAQAGPRTPDSWRSSLLSVVHDFTAAWERGEAPAVENYLRYLDPGDVQGAVDLIYREYCLAEADGQSPEPDSYFTRFPRHAEVLRGLFQFHGACSPSLLERLMGPAPASWPAIRAPGEPAPVLPQAGDSVGPYLLRRELGRGSFARVFLAEQVDLASRLVVVKIATRSTREPWLLARARHAHIVEILSHAEVDDGAFQLICMPFWGGATLADVLAAPSGRRPGMRKSGHRPSTGADLLAALDAAAAPEYPSVHPARPAREILAPLSYDRAIAWVIARLAEALDHASSRDVAHGDIKPSNILLSADGNPMLLDFNLARDATPVVDPAGRPIDPGGTLAYMAPERLRALALAGSGRAYEAVEVDGDPESDGMSDKPQTQFVGSSASMGAHTPAIPAGTGAQAPAVSAPGGCSVSPRAHTLNVSVLTEHPTSLLARGSAPAGGSWSVSDLSADRAAHVADLYSLGMVLLEALSGRPPSEAAIPGDRNTDPAGRPARLISTARAYAAARERPARALIRDFAVASGRPIAPALGAILGRCLDPDPGRRYRRALELAEDLDRWRTDRPLAYADEPFWGQAVPRWLRVRRRMLIVAALSLLAVGLATTALVLIGSNRMLRQDFETLGQGKLARQWDDPESGAFLRSQRWPSPHVWTPDDPEAFEVARRALLDYEVIEPGGAPAAGDWRLREDVCHLPPADREDLDLWLLERAYRYCRALEDRPASPEDWRQALEILDRVAGHRSIRAFGPLMGRLAAKLEQARASRGTTATAGVSSRRSDVGSGSVVQPSVPVPGWLDEHLLGWLSECHSEPEAGSRDAQGHHDRTAIERALRHYEQALMMRPDSFWTHHRAASACFGLGRIADTAHHLAECLKRRPRNAVVQAQLAGCLIALKQFPEALELCDRALEEAPRYAEAYRTRAYARATSRQTGGIEDDLRHFEMLSQILPRSFWGDMESGDSPKVKDIGLVGSKFPGPRGLQTGVAWRWSRDQAGEIESDEIEARTMLTEALRQAEEFALVRAEVDKILVIQPDHLHGRMLRADQAIADRQFDTARSELDAVLGHPGLEDYVRGNKASLGLFFNITKHYLAAGKTEDARRVVDRARELAIQLRRDVGNAHYLSAEVYAVLGASDADYIEQAAKQLFRAFVAHPDFSQWYRIENPRFDPVRARIDAALGRMEDPAVVRRRLMNRSSASTTRQVAGR
jgi:eukaryotic-like serine/threonine-protein kinase